MIAAIGERGQRGLPARERMRVLTDDRAQVRRLEAREDLPRVAARRVRDRQPAIAELTRDVVVDREPVEIVDQRPERIAEHREQRQPAQRRPAQRHGLGLDRRGHLRPHLRKLAADHIHHFHRVGVRLSLDRKHDGT